MIKISGLWAGYGGLDILRGVDLDVPEGQITCIVGPNGAGKSTVLKTVTGILRPSRGSVIIGGADLTGQPPEVILRAGVACVPQRHGLFARLTVRQNVLMGAYVIRRRRAQIEARYEQLAEMFPLLADASRRQRGHPVRRPAPHGRVRPRADARAPGRAARRADPGPRPAHGGPDLRAASPR